jgi:hypothetical protein
VNGKNMTGMTFTRGQLGLSDQELDSLSNALANQEQPDPIAEEIAVQTGVIDGYVGEAVIAEGWRWKWIRALVIRELYSRCGAVPENHQKSYEAAIRELEGFRDGKFLIAAVQEAAVMEREKSHEREDQDGL